MFNPANNSSTHEADTRRLLQIQTQLGYTDSNNNQKAQEQMNQEKIQHRAEEKFDIQHHRFAISQYTIQFAQKLSFYTALCKFVLLLNWYGSY